MKAAQITTYGGKDALVYTAEAAKPEPGPGEVLVKVHAAAANPFDYKLREGNMQEFIKLQLPATLGGDVAGEVAELGANVTDFSVGQVVLGQANAAGGHGSYAEYTPVKVEQLVPKPDNLGYETAASIPLAGSSAYQAIVDHMDLQPGQKILVHGGAGGIGSYAVQIAKSRGAHVTTTAGADDRNYVTSLGADEVIDYRKQQFQELIHDYDAVFDTVGGETNKQSYGVLKAGGTLVSMVESPNEALVSEHDITYIQQATKTTSKRLQAVAELVGNGKLKVNIDKVFTLEDAAEALEYLKTGHPKGKVVIRVIGE
jgi:alcohol dehydrogenase